MPTLENYLESNANRFEDELCDFLRIASVSADPNCKGEMLRAADWLAQKFRKLGFTAEIIPTSGHPLVFAESPRVPDAPTVLVYGHYDVQPAEPLEKWTNPPFDPVKRDGKLYARGASDDKGQVFSHILSAEAILQTVGKLPINLKYLVEGEEEVGSAGLGQFLLTDAAKKLKSDCIVISDGSQFGPGLPAINYGLRGLAYFEVRLQGPNRDLHSGSFGGSVTNPANALAKMLAGLINEKGQIQVPGFYDDVVPLTDRERKQFADLPFDEKTYFKNVGVEGAIGEEGYTALERRWARPTFDICGLWSGYQGEGSKTVLPAQAGAKISFRLVPNQTPEKVAAGLKQKLEELCPPGIKMEFIEHHGGNGVLVSLESPYIEAAARAIEYAFGRRPVFTREGGSIPIVAKFAEHLKVDTLLMGWGQEDDNAHSPNEKFSLSDYHKAIKASAKLWEELGK
jgi:succinyl-diaminopimelate desuccinylase